MSDATIIVLIVAVGVTLGLGNVILARRRALRYFRGAGFAVIQLKLRWRRQENTPFQHSAGTVIFYAHLQDKNGNAVPAWVCAAGIFAFLSSDPLDVKFSPTRAFPDFPSL